MRFGVIGTTGIVDVCHAPALAAIDPSALGAVLSRDAARGAAFLQKHGAVNAQTYTTLESFAAAPGIDAVIIASPDKLHAEQAIACLKAGKHVLLEKPFATSQYDADLIAAAVADSGKQLMIGFHLRQHVGHQLLRKMLQDGAIGTLQHIRAVWAFPNTDNSNWRAHDDLGKWWSLAAVGSHCMDITRWVADDFMPFARFTSMIDKSRWGGPHDETAVLSGQFKNGVTFEVTSSVKFGPYNRLEVFGDAGFLVGSDTFGRHGAGKITLNAVEQPFTPVNPFEAQLRVFIDAVHNNRTPENNAGVGLRSTADLLQAVA